MAGDPHRRARQPEAEQALSGRRPRGGIGSPPRAPVLSASDRSPAGCRAALAWSLAACPQRVRRDGPEAPAGRAHKGGHADPAAGQDAVASWTGPLKAAGCGKRPRAQGPGPVHGLARDRASAPTAKTSTSPPRRATRSRSSAATRAGHADAADRGRRAASPPKAPAAARRRSGSTGPTRLPSAPTAATSTRPRGRATRSASSSATSKTRRADPAAGQRRLHRRACRFRSAPAAARWSAPTWSSSAPTGENVYVGSFFGNAVAVFDRDPVSGALTPARRQHAAASPKRSAAARSASRSAPRRGWRSAATAPASTSPAPSPTRSSCSARDQTTGTLTQATDGSGCIVNSALAGCTTGVQLSGANAVAFNPGGDVYVTSLFSNSVTSFTRSRSTGGLAQKQGTAGCLVCLRAAGCSFGRALRSPEGLAVSPDGAERLRRGLHHRRDRRPRSQQEGPAR